MYYKLIIIAINLKVGVDVGILIVVHLAYYGVVSLIWSVVIDTNIHGYQLTQLGKVFKE